MKYIVIEIQVNNDVVSAIPYGYNDLNSAYAKYFTILSAAAISQLTVHSCCILEDDGTEIIRFSFNRRTEI